MDLNGKMILNVKHFGHKEDYLLGFEDGLLHRSGRVSLHGRRESYFEDEIFGMVWKMYSRYSNGRRLFSFEVSMME